MRKKCADAHAGHQFLTELVTYRGTDIMKEICQVCMHHCSLEPAQTGLCRARKNENGKIICANYGMVTSLALDPIEKKPLYMFHPAV